MENINDSLEIVGISKGPNGATVLKLKVPTRDGEQQRSLHFLPKGTSIGVHAHNASDKQSEIYVFQVEDKWDIGNSYNEYLERIAGKWDDKGGKHGVSTTKENTIVFGAKRPNEKGAWLNNDGAEEVPDLYKDPNIGIRISEIKLTSAGISNTNRENNKEDESCEEKKSSLFAVSIFYPEVKKDNDIAKVGETNNTEKSEEGNHADQSEDEQKRKFNDEQKRKFNEELIFVYIDEKTSLCHVLQTTPTESVFKVGEGEQRALDRPWISTIYRPIKSQDGTYKYTQLDHLKEGTSLAEAILELINIPSKEEKGDSSKNNSQQGTAVEERDLI